MHESSGSVIESQVDWLTVSAHGEDAAWNMLVLAEGLAKEEEARGAKPRKWRSMGYEGLHVGRVEYGQRDTRSAELRLSGDASARHLDAALSLADAVTRLDLAVTWQADDRDDWLGQRTLARAIEHAKGRPKAALPWTVNDAAGGFTMYLGARTSSYFFRLYNKEAQERAQMGKGYDGRYDRCWRYELEIKGSAAWAVAHKVQDTDNRPLWCQEYIHTYAAAHGLLPPFDSAGGQRLIPGFRRKSDEDTKLAHLRRNVRPSANFLRERGRDEDLREVLGFHSMAPALRQLQELVRVPWPTMGESGRGNGPQEGDAHGKPEIREVRADQLGGDELSAGA